MYRADSAETLRPMPRCSVCHGSSPFYGGSNAGSTRSTWGVFRPFTSSSQAIIWANRQNTSHSLPFTVHQANAALEQLRSSQPLAPWRRPVSVLTVQAVPPSPSRMGSGRCSHGRKARTDIFDIPPRTYRRGTRAGKGEGTGKEYDVWGERYGFTFQRKEEQFAAYTAAVAGRGPRGWGRSEDR